MFFPGAFLDGRIQFFLEGQIRILITSITGSITMPWSTPEKYRLYWLLYILLVWIQIQISPDFSIPNFKHFTIIVCVCVRGDFFYFSFWKSGLGWKDQQSMGIRLDPNPGLIIVIIGNRICNTEFMGSKLSQIMVLEGEEWYHTNRFHTRISDPW